MPDKFSRDRRRLPRMAIGSKREPNRLLVLMAHDPIFVEQGTGLRIAHPGRKVLGMAWLGARGPWVVVLHRDNYNGEQPSYEALRLLPVPSHWGHTPLDDMRTAVRREVQSIVHDWNEGPVKPKVQEDVFMEHWWTSRDRP